MTGLDSTPRLSSRISPSAGLLVITRTAPGGESICRFPRFYPASAVNLLSSGNFITPIFSPKARNKGNACFLDWLNQGKGIFVAPYTALLSRAVAPSLWRSFITWVEIEQKVDRDELLGRLVEVGYERVPLIEGQGQCSGRGDIIDVYPFGWQQPLRITLFDDTVESIRLFDLHTQRSTDHLPRAGILPAGEMPLPENI